MSIDISDIAEKNRLYAIHLATCNDIVIYKNSVYEIANVRENEPFKTVDFWRNISLSAEILLKACLLKHHVVFFKKRANYEYGEKVVSLKNLWLEKTLKELEIDYVAQINTGTVSTAIRSAQNKLFEKISLDPQKAKLISEMFYIIIRTRRNRNSHFFFPNQSFINITEVEMLFLPLLNLLQNIYELKIIYNNRI